MSNHGYGAYTRGCRCGPCREAKAAYMRQRRADAKRIAAWRNSHSPTHGPGEGCVSKYDEHGCRCAECTSAKSWKRDLELARQRARAVNSRYARPS